MWPFVTSPPPSASLRTENPFYWGRTSPCARLARKARAEPETTSSEGSRSRSGCHDCLRSGGLISPPPNQVYAHANHPLNLNRRETSTRSAPHKVAKRVDIHAIPSFWRRPRREN